MIKALRNSNEYKMVNLEGYGSPLKHLQDRKSASTPFKAYLDRVEVDNRSIFVGNLPSTATEDDLKALFGGYGTIEDITVRESFSKYNGKYFVPYCRSCLTSLKPLSASTLPSSSLDLELLPILLSTSW